MTFSRLALAQSLLRDCQFHCERPPVVSVTPDITASASFQAASRSTRPEPADNNDRFASLVDSNTNAAANNSDRVQDQARDLSRDQVRDPAPPPAAKDSPRRADDAATADDRPARDAGRADQPARNDAKDNNVAADQADAGADAKAQPDHAGRGKAKTTAKSEDSKAAAKQPARDSAASDSS